jgi:hypothetical protein
MGRQLPRPVALLATIAAGSALVLSWFVGPALEPDASARERVRPTATYYVIQVPPPVPGIDYSGVGEPVGGPAEALTQASPAPATGTTSGAPALESSPDGGYSTSLGGSDIAVSSVGGSHERDGRGKRDKKDAPQAGTIP